MKMTNEEAIKILTEHQKWRRVEPPYEHGGEGMPHTPKELWVAIDHAINALQTQAELLAALRDFHEIAKDSNINAVYVNRDILQKAQAKHAVAIANAEKEGE